MTLPRTDAQKYATFMQLVGEANAAGRPGDAAQYWQAAQDLTPAEHGQPPADLGREAVR